MKTALRRIMNSIASYIELLLSALLAIAILFVIVRFFREGFLGEAASEYEMEYYLTNAMNIAIGLEFIRMLCYHSPGTVIEVLLFAISRHIVVEHLTVYETLVGVISIAILFATRKFLFASFDETEHIVLRGRQPVGLANFISRARIPEDSDVLLRDVVERRLKEEGRTVAVGAIVQYKHCALRVDSIHEGVITRVEVIRLD